MKRTTLLISFLLCVSFGFAQWTSPGNGQKFSLTDLCSSSIGAATMLSDGHCLIASDLTISANDTLFLEEIISTLTLNDTVDITIEGYAVCAQRTDSLTIAGEGTAEEDRFVWRFSHAPASTLSNIIFKQGEKVSLVESDITFDRCEFTGFTSHALTYMTCNPVIQNCYFHDNQKAAINSGANILGAPKILNNVLYNNDLSNSNTPQINIGPSENDTIIIDGNLIEGVANNMSGGIAIGDMMNMGNTIARISNNTIIHNRYGYTQMGYTINAIIDNNRIQDNNLETDPMNGGSGISIYGYTTNCSAKLRNNIISGNLWGITCIYQHSTDMGTADDPGNNVLYGNSNGGVEYALFNNSGCDMNAIGNYWGTNDEVAAEDVISHHADQDNLGTVTYLPIMTLEPEIIAFNFLQKDNATLSEDVIGTIDAEAHTITLQLPAGSTSDNTFIPEIVLPLGVTCTPNDGEAQVFPNGSDVIYTVSTPHGTAQDWAVKVINTTGIEAQMIDNITIFPNPAHAKFTIVNNTDNVMPMAVFNAYGQCIYQENVMSGQNIIPTASWESGIYFVKAKQGNKILTKKIVIL